MHWRPPANNYKTPLYYIVLGAGFTADVFFSCYLAISTCYLAISTCYLAISTCYLAISTCYLAISTCALDWTRNMEAISQTIPLYDQDTNEREI